MFTQSLRWMVGKRDFILHSKINRRHLLVYLATTDFQASERCVFASVSENCHLAPNIARSMHNQRILYYNINDIYIYIHLFKVKFSHF